VVETILEKERPDAVLPTRGADGLKPRHPVVQTRHVRGSALSDWCLRPAIARAEDRETVQNNNDDMGWMCRRSGFAHTPEEALGLINT